MVPQSCSDLKITKWGGVWGGEDRVVVKTGVKGREKCPHCGSGKVYGHGMCKPREVLHTWSNGKKVYLELHRRRWKCRDCKHTFAEGRGLVRSRSRLTRPAEAEALWQLKDRNFSQVTRELGIGYGRLTGRLHTVDFGWGLGYNIGVESKQHQLRGSRNLR